MGSAIARRILDSLINWREAPGWMPVLLSEDRLSATAESLLYNKTGRSVYMLPLVSMVRTVMSSLDLATPAASARERDRKNTRLNSSHANISYAVFCLKKKK